MRPISLLVITTNAPEHHAMVKHVSARERHVYKNEAYILGTLKGQNQEFELIIREPGKTGTDLKTGTLQAIRLFQPHFAFIMGLAAGTGKLASGDVLISNQLLVKGSSKSDKKKLPTWLNSNNEPPLFQFLNGLDNGSPAKSALPNFGFQPGVLVSNEDLIALSNRKNPAKAIAVAPETEGFFEALHSSTETPGMALMAINNCPEGSTEAQASSKLAIKNLVAAALDCWQQMDCKEYILDSLESKHLAEDAFSRLFPFPEAVREIDHDFSSGFNKSYQEVWNLVKPLLIEEIFAFKRNPRDRDHQSDVQEKLRRALQDQKQLRHALGTLLKQASSQPLN